MRRSAILPIGLVVIAVASACGGSDPAPSGSNSTSGGTIAGTSTSGFVNSSGGASGKTSSGGTTGPQPTDLVETTDETLDFNGTTRPYLLSKPKTITPDRKYALVISFHGNPGSPKEQHDLLPFDSASKDAAFIAYPQAADGSEWNLNLPSDGNEDMDFVKALIDDLASKQPIDTTRVLGFGYSGGAYFLSQYACRVGGVLKMVALLAGGAPEFHDGVDEKRPDDCVICPAGATPIFIAHGMNDTSDSPFEGGDFARICWAEQNGCTNSSLHQLAAPCATYNGCDDGKPVEWCPVPDQDHSPWGGSIQAAWTMFNGL